MVRVVVGVMEGLVVVIVVVARVDDIDIGCRVVVIVVVARVDDIDIGCRVVVVIVVVAVK